MSGQKVAAKTVTGWIVPNVKKGAYVFASDKPNTVSIDKKTGQIAAKATGTARITVYIAGNTNYNPSPSKSFNVTVTVPAQPTLTKATASGKKIKATWKAQAAANGFLVEYAKDSKFTKGKGSFKVANTKSKQTTGAGPGKGLARGVWYVRLYAYGNTDKIRSKASKKVFNVTIK